MSSIAYLNGEFLPLDQARISVLDRGFLFADGIYEVSAVLDGHLVDNRSHLERFQRSVGEIALALPETLDRIEEIEKELIARNGLKEGIVYMQVTRGAAPRDFHFPDIVEPTLLMFVQTKNISDSPAAKTGIKVKTLEDIRWARRDIKSIALLAQVLAKQAAHEAGCQEAWMVEDGYVTEGGSSSVFIITKNDVLIARPNSHALLPGCTRKALLALAAEKNIRVEERLFTVAEALDAAEAFYTSASSFVTPVVMIDGAPIGAGVPGPLTKRLRDIYFDFARASR
ncbi:MAG: D-amino-acid transaminase [Rhodospirillaceae bacterium]|nr:D-amino-acid transaminase [Rhodospirillaceae bacterium]